MEARYGKIWSVLHLRKKIQRLKFHPTFLSLLDKPKHDTWHSLVHFDDQNDENGCDQIKVIVKEFSTTRNSPNLNHDIL